MSFLSSSSEQEVRSFELKLFEVLWRRELIFNQISLWTSAQNQLQIALLEPLKVNIDILSLHF